MSRSIDGPGFAETLVEESPDALLAVDPQGTILFWNRGATGIFGYSREEAVGRNLEDLLVPEELRGESERAIAEALRSGFVIYESVRRRKDGRLVEVDVSKRVVREPDGSVRFLAVGTKDVSTLRRLRSLKREMELLTESARLRDEFVASVSHELRTPLNAILGFGQLLADGKAGPLTDRQAEFLEDVLRSGHRLLDLVNGLLELPSSQVDEVVVRREEVDVDALLADVHAVLRPMAMRRRSEVRIEGSAGTVLGEAARVKQMFFQYLSNALKVSPEGACIKVRALRGGGWVRVEVWDSGPGLAQDGDRGLALTRRLAEAHGGRVGVESEPGRGSTFWLELPT